MTAFPPMMPRLPNDPRIRVLLARAATLRDETRRTVVETRLAIDVTDQLLRDTRRLLASDRAECPPRNGHGPAFDG